MNKSRGLCKMLYGGMEVQFFQITPTGSAKIQMGNWPNNVSVATRRVVGDLAKLGGTAEWDELKMQAGSNPMALGTGLRRAMDLGYVTPVTMPGAVR